MVVVEPDVDQPVLALLIRPHFGRWGYGRVGGGGCPRAGSLDQVVRPVRIVARPRTTGGPFGGRGEEERGGFQQRLAPRPPLGGNQRGRSPRGGGHGSGPDPDPGRRGPPPPRRVVPAHAVAQVVG